MKKALKILGISLLSVAGAAALLLFGLNRLIKNAMTSPMVPEDYAETLQTGGALEARYLSRGPYRVERAEWPAPEGWGSFVVYWPSEPVGEERRYPAAVFVNGTGVGASRYAALFEHLASRGFIVAGNEDPSTCSGASANATLELLLELNSDAGSALYNRVDTENIGISGHSQGGVGVYNAVAADARYKCAVSLSPTAPELAAALSMGYDPESMDIPVLILAAAENDVIDAAGVRGLFNSARGTAAAALRPGSNHGELLYAGDGYVTTWFEYWLRGDTSAGEAFFGGRPELEDNALWTGFMAKTE